MKTTFPILIALLLFITSCTEKNVIIEGTIKDFNAEEGIIALVTTPNVNFSWYFRDTIDVDSTGYFRIEIPTDDAIFVGLTFYRYFGMDFIVEEGENHSIIVDLSAKKIIFNTKSKNQEGIDLMDTYTSEEALGSFSLLGLYRKKDSTFEETITNVKKEKDRVLAELKQLYDAKKISKSFYELALIDGELFYKGLTAHFAYYEAYDLLQKEQEVPKQVTIYLEENLADVNNSKYINSSWWWTELANIAIVKRINIDMDRDEKDSILGVMRAGKANTINISIAEKVFSEKKLLEAYTANAIYASIFQTRSKFDKELIDNFAKFEEDFPNSEYSQYIKPQIDIIKGYYKKLEDDYSENVKFVQNSDEIDSFEELVALFKGKKLYVDIWATWCGPCKEEFKHNIELKKLLKEKDVEMLYISRDRDEQKWREDIKYFDLDGSHIRVNQSLDSDLFKMSGGVLGIPKYIIVDETGKILNKDAPAPSALDELRKML